MASISLLFFLAGKIHSTHFPPSEWKPPLNRVGRLLITTESDLIAVPIKASEGVQRKHGLRREGKRVLSENLGAGYDMGVDIFSRPSSKPTHMVRDRTDGRALTEFPVCKRSVRIVLIVNFPPFSIEVNIMLRTIKYL